jgi:putative addiction module component (TIGR02574 family)
MPLTLEQIIEETRRWPPEKLGELVGRLSEDLHASTPEVEVAWRREIDRRVKEIRSGKVQGVSGEEVTDEVAKIAGR